MCGIAGLIDLTGQRPVSHQLLQRMASVIIHRGPDEGGFYNKPGIGFASRRLSIVGLKDGQQPISNETGSVSVVYNGELFDHVERRRELEARGHRFRTHCDTEILVHLWEEHGPDMLERLDGQFAFALHDENANTITLARDRFGICPLYWARANMHDRDWLVFGSEIKAILASGLVEARPDRRGIDQIFNFLAVPPPVSCFEGIHALPPGRFLTIDLNRSGADAEISERTYWTMDFPDAGDEERGRSETEVADEFEALLRAAVERRLRADVPVVSYLSGGVDSSTVVALARDTLGRTPPTFTVKVLDPKLDETAQAAEISAKLHAQPFIVPCGTDDIVRNYQALVQAAEAPVPDTSCTALMQLAHKVRQEGYKVALTGEGADEWLAGYAWYKMDAIFGTLGRIFGERLQLGIRHWLGRRLGFEDEGERYARALIEAAGGRHPGLNFYSLLNVNRFRFYAGEMHAALADCQPYALLEPDLDRVRRWDPINRGVYWSGKIHLAGQLLSLKGDRVAMSQSVEMRYPFLDNTVFDFLARIDPKLKLKGLREKYLLRLVAERWLPKKAAWRPKGMFRAPLDGFFLEDRLPYVDQLLSEESLRKTGYFDPDAVAHWRQQRPNLSDLFLKRSSVEFGLVAVLATQLWHHTYIDPTLADLPDWRSLAGLTDEEPVVTADAPEAPSAHPGL